MTSSSKPPLASIRTTSLRPGGCRNVLYLGVTSSTPHFRDVMLSLLEVDGVRRCPLHFGAVGYGIDRFCARRSSLTFRGNPNVEK